MHLSVKLLLALLGALALSASLPVQSAEVSAPDYDTLAQAARATVTRFVEADTTSPPGNEARIAQMAAKRLDEAGIACEITEFAPGRENVVARLKATGTPTAKPLLLLAYEDVVTAQGQAWTSDPHKVTIKDGYLVARGISDDLGMAAIHLEVFIQLKKSGVPLRRDVILALTGDEESDGQGIKYLLKHKSQSIDAEIAINEGGHIFLDEAGKTQHLGYSAAEKIYQDFELATSGQTGHSAIPVKDNAIYRLSRALSRIDASPEPARLIPLTRAYFAARAALEKPPISEAMRTLSHAQGPKLPTSALKILESNPRLSANLRTTCVATTVRAGTRVNALPADAVANINCRILPDDTVEKVRLRLEKVIGDPLVKITAPKDSGHGPASSVEGEAAKAIEKAAHAMWPGLPIVPTLMQGASDSRFLRQAGIAAYGINPLPISDADAMRMHGVDERVPLASFRTGVEFMHKLVLEMAAR